MKKESINEVITPIMQLIYNSNINSKDKTELMIVLGRYLEAYKCENKLIRKRVR